MNCEFCLRKEPKDAPFDYCAICRKPHCPDCMKKGCCGVKPAISGRRVDEQAGEI